ncbi:hypothetical protein DN33_3302 [Vibrio cholerae]|nr:hypothetical protein DN33_3302 [Vibrio cholerae]
MLIFKLAAQCVTRIGWVNHYPTIANNRNRLVDQAGLRVLRMNIKKLAHGYSSSSSLSTLLLGDKPQSFHTGSTPAGNQRFRPNSIQGEG